MRIPFFRKATGTLRTLRAPLLFRRMVRQSVPAKLTDAPALIIAPHADDETFGCGGVIAFKRQRGVPVTILFLTRGDASHPHENPDTLVAKRKAEALAAAAHLRVPPGDVIFLDGPDGKLDAMTPPQQSAMVQRIADLLAEKHPGEVYVPHRHDHHPDHEAANRIARQAIAQAQSNTTLLEYPIWLLWWAPLNQPASRMGLESARRINLPPAAATAKSAAIAVYQSQLPSMPWQFMTQFTAGFELFFKND